jgi:hypothetical protein
MGSFKERFRLPMLMEIPLSDITKMARKTAKGFKHMLHLSPLDSPYLRKKMIKQRMKKPVSMRVIGRET